MSKRRLAILLTVLMAFVGPALASGFHVYEQGAKASGQAVAFVARADNASGNWYNPAAIVKFDGFAVSTMPPVSIDVMSQVTLPEAVDRKVLVHEQSTTHSRSVIDGMLSVVGSPPSAGSAFS